MAGVFRAYDIRGKVGSEINVFFANDLGKAFATLYPGEIVIGYDVRKESPELAKAFAEGVISTGSKVIDIGFASTPLVAFATRFFCYDAGVSVTASHLSSEYAGFKFYDENAVAISYERGMRKIEETFHKQNFAVGKGTKIKREVINEYIRYIFYKLKIARDDFAVAIDCMRGVMGLIAPVCLREVCEELKKLRCDASGEFDGAPDPSEAENLEVLKDAVKENGLEVGFAYDGDGDRLAVIDDRGEVVPPTIVFALLIENELGSDGKGKKVVVDVLTSDVIIESIEKAGAIPILCRVGTTYIMEKMFHEGATLGGELSGHYYFRQVFGLDDALFASLKLLEFLSRKKQRLSELRKRIKLPFLKKERVPVKKGEKHKFVEKLKERFEKLGYEMETIDGIKLRVRDGWICVRASNTEEKITIVYEGKTKSVFKKLENLANEIKSEIPQ